jgi:hypothetical protein
MEALLLPRLLDELVVVGGPDCPQRRPRQDSQRPGKPIIRRRAQRIPDGLSKLRATVSALVHVVLRHHRQVIEAMELDPEFPGTGFQKV